MYIMKLSISSLLIIFIVLTSINTIQAQTLNISEVNLPSTTELDELFLAPDDVLYAVHIGREQLSKSLDGLNWTEMSLPDSVSIQNMYFFSDGQILLLGSDKLYRQNNENEWQEIFTLSYIVRPATDDTSGSSYIKYNSVFIDEDIVYALSDYSVYVSYDKGETFSKKYESDCKEPFLTDQRFMIKVSEGRIYLACNMAITILDLNFNKLNFIDYTNSEVFRHGDANIIDFEVIGFKILFYSTDHFSNNTSVSNCVYLSYTEIVGSNLKSIYEACVYYYTTRKDFQQSVFLRDGKVYIANTLLSNNRAILFDFESEFIDDEYLLDFPYKWVDNGRLTYAYDNNFIFKINDLTNPAPYIIYAPIVGLDRIENFKIDVDNTIYFQSNSHLFSSANYGVSWTFLNGITETVISYDIAPNGDLFVLTQGFIYFSKDKGQTFIKNPLREDADENGDILVLSTDLIFITGTNESYSTDQGRTWLYNRGIKASNGRYYELNENIHTGNKIVNPVNFNLEPFFNVDAENALMVDSTLIHFNQKDINGPSYYTSDQGATFIELESGPAGQLYKGPNRESTYVYNGSNKELYYRDALDRIYQEINIDVIGDRDILYFDSDSDGHIYLLLRDEDDNSIPYIGYIDCQSLTLSLESIEDAIICEGEDFLGYTESGQYTIDLISQGGCDSTHILNLQVEVMDTVVIAKTICQGQTHDGYDNDGQYMYTSISDSGCDIWTDLELTVLDIRSDTSFVTNSICIGGSYLDHSIAGSYTDTLMDQNACYIQITELSIIDDVYTSDTIKICDGDSFNGLTTTGTYIDTLMTVAGCDSIVTSILEVYPSVEYNLDVELCIGSSYNGYTQSGRYLFTSTYGCDSIMNLNLEFVEKYEKYNVVKICEGESYGSYDSPGIYIDTLSAIGDCDSIVISEVDIEDCEIKCADQLHLQSSYGAFGYYARMEKDMLVVTRSSAGWNANGDLQQIVVYENIDNDWVRTLYNIPEIITWKQRIEFHNNYAISYGDYFEVFEKDSLNNWNSILVDYTYQNVRNLKIYNNEIVFNSFNDSNKGLIYGEIVNNKIEFSKFNNLFSTIHRVRDGVVLQAVNNEIYIYRKENNNWVESILKSKYQLDLSLNQLWLSENRIITTSRGQIHSFVYDGTEWNESIIKSKFTNDDFLESLTVVNDRIVTWGEEFTHLFTWNGTQWIETIVNDEPYTNAKFNGQYISYLREGKYNLIDISSTPSNHTTFTVDDLTEIPEELSLGDNWVMIINNSYSNIYEIYSDLILVPISSYFDDNNNDGFGDRISQTDTLYVTICEGDEYNGYTESGTYNTLEADGVICEVLVLDVTTEDDNPDCITSSIIDNNEAKISVSPNPFSSELYVNIPDGMQVEQITITNLHGQVVSTYSSFSRAPRIDLSDIDNGMYIVTIDHDSGRSVIPVVKVE